MRFWLWVAILSGLFTMEWGREWRQPTLGVAAESGTAQVADDPYPHPTPRP